MKVVAGVGTAAGTAGVRNEAAVEVDEEQQIPVGLPIVGRGMEQEAHPS